MSVTSSSPMLNPLDPRHLRPSMLFLHLCGVGVMLVILGFANQSSLRPVIAEHRGIVRQVRSMKKLADRGPDILAQRASMQRWVMEREASCSMERVPESLLEEAFHDRLAELAKSCGLSNVRVIGDDPVAMESHLRQEIEVQASADYAGLCRFLEGLQTSPRLCPVSQLRVKKSRGNAEQLELALTLRIYAAPLVTASLEETPHE